MRNSITTVLDYEKSIDEYYVTEPLEVGWAKEGVFWLGVRGVSGTSPILSARVQVSSDGLRWVNEGTIFPPIINVGEYFVKIKNFGNFVRLELTPSGVSPVFRTTISFSGKDAPPLNILVLILALAGGYFLAKELKII